MTRQPRHCTTAGMTGMTTPISQTSFDCRDASPQSLFWAVVRDFAPDADNTDGPGDEECMIFSPDGTQRVPFIEVPGPKQVKNRVHLDLVPAEGTRDQELTRPLEAGARVRACPPGWPAAGPEGGPANLHMHSLNVRQLAP